MLTDSRIWLLLAAIPIVEAQVLNSAIFEPSPYSIDVDPTFIEQTRLKASRFRATIDIEQAPWSDGPPFVNVTEVAKYWENSFDWTTYQDQINRNFSHYITTLPPPGDGYNRSLDVHFIHQLSSRSDAIPLLMLHGWPSTSLEWAEVIPLLVNPSNSSHPAFHVVAPDIPGYGFSPAPLAPGLGKEAHATVFANLMAQLGYDRYAIYSTDFGFVVAQGMVSAYASHIINHVTDFYLVFPSPSDMEKSMANESTPEESAYISSFSAFVANHSAYAEIHSTLPLSIAYALNDSPMGFLAWMWQLVFTGSDGLQSPHDLITRALLLFIPGVYGNIRSYKELYGPDKFAAPLTSVSTSVLQFGRFGRYTALADLTFVPRAWVERTANVTYFSRHPAGGHFPAIALAGPVVLRIGVNALATSLFEFSVAWRRPWDSNEKLVNC